MTTPASVFRPGATALITGGASGVGLAVAQLCASHGMSLILVDNNAEALAAAKSALPADAKVEFHTLDVSSAGAWTDLKTRLESAGRTLDFLHLNAGIGRNGTWTDAGYFADIFGVNLFGVVHGLNAFVPQFQQKDGAAPTATNRKAIVITGSKQGITNPPGNPAYNASKSAVKTLAEHLSFDLAKDSPATSVHLLVPGWTHTGLTGGGPGGREKPAGAWAPEQVAEYLYKKMSEGKFYVICPDNDVDWETDRKRMTWSMGDIVYERQPQSRWREDYKEEATATMANMRIGDKQAGSSA